jgi:hypothetical protein
MIPQNPPFTPPHQDETADVVINRLTSSSAPSTSLRTAASAPPASSVPAAVHPGSPRRRWTRTEVNALLYAFSSSSMGETSSIQGARKFPAFQIAAVVCSDFSNSSIVNHGRFAWIMRWQFEQRRRRSVSLVFAASCKETGSKRGYRCCRVRLVSIGRRPRHAKRTNRPARTGRILHHHLLTENFAHALSNDARRAANSMLVSHAKPRRWVRP